MLNNRSIVIIVAAILGCALLGPYIGVHLFTNSPTLTNTPPQLRETGRRPTVSSRPPSARSERTTADSMPLEIGGRDLSEIENLLGRNGRNTGAPPTARDE